MGSTRKCSTLLLLLSAFTLTVSGTTLTYCEKVIDLTFILDQSESLRDEDPYDKPDHTWNMVKDFTKGLVRRLPVNRDDVNVALVKYSDTAKVMWPMRQYTSQLQLLGAIDGLQCEGGNTNTAQALQLTYEEFYQRKARIDARNVVIIFTDGMSNVNEQYVRRYARYLWRRDTEVYAVAVGKYVDEDELKEIVQYQFGKYLIHVPDYDRLPAFENLLAHRVCGLPDPRPPTEEECQTKKMDLTFIVDSSGSIKSALFIQLKQTLVEIVTQLDIGPDLTRVAAVSFSDNATREFHLGDYRDEYHLRQKLMGIEFKNGNTNTSGAFRVTLKDVYFGNPGDRDDVMDVVVLITDGASTLEKNNTLQEAIRAKLRGIEIYAIGVTNKINVKELEHMVSKPIRDHLYESTHIKYLYSDLINLVKSLCDNTDMASKAI